MPAISDKSWVSPTYVTLGGIVSNPLLSRHRHPIAGQILLFIQHLLTYLNCTVTTTQQQQQQQQQQQLSAMASPALEAHVKSLNAKLDGKAKTMLDDIEKQTLRPIARQSYVCAVSCYDKAGKTGPAEQIQHCVQQCQAPYQQAQAVVNNEVHQFQDRLNRAMMQCNDEARDFMTPDIQTNAKQMKLLEDTVGKCFTNCVDKHIGLLGGMKSRVVSQLKQL